MATAHTAVAAVYADRRPGVQSRAQHQVEAREGHAIYEIWQEAAKLVPDGALAPVGEGVIGDRGRPEAAQEELVPDPAEHVHY